MDVLQQEWSVRSCTCGYSNCKSALIEPGIVKYQGAVEREVAEHIVELHNAYLNDSLVRARIKLRRHFAGVREGREWVWRSSRRSDEQD